MLKTRNVKFPIPKAPQLQIMNINNFKGIDLTENPFGVDYNSASDMLNLYINKAGVLTLRPRTETVYDLKNLGILEEDDELITLYKKNNGDFIYHVLREGNGLIFKLVEGNVIPIDLDDDITIPVSKIKFFEKDNTLYLLSENGYMLLNESEDKIYNVKDHADTYIPLTRVGRSLSEEYIVDSDDVTLKSGSSFEPFNLLNKKYKESYFFTQDDLVKNKMDINIKDYYETEIIHSANNDSIIFVNEDYFYRLTKILGEFRIYKHNMNGGSGNLVYTFPWSDTSFPGIYTISPNGRYLCVLPYLGYSDGNYVLSPNIHVVDTAVDPIVPLDVEVINDADRLMVTDTGVVYTATAVSEKNPPYAITVNIFTETSGEYTFKTSVQPMFSGSHWHLMEPLKTVFDAKRDMFLYSDANNIYFCNNVKASTLSYIDISRNDNNIEISGPLSNKILDETKLMVTGLQTNKYFKNRTSYVLNILEDEDEEYKIDVIRKSNSTHFNFNSRLSVTKYMDGILYHTKHADNGTFELYTDGDILNKNTGLQRILHFDNYNKSFKVTNLFDITSDMKIYADNYETITEEPYEYKSSVMILNYNTSSEPLVVIEKELSDDEYNNLLFAFDGYERFDNEYHFFGNSNRIYHTLNNNPTYIPDYGERIIGDDTRVRGFNVAGLSTLIALKSNKTFALIPTEIRGFRTYNITELRTTIGDITIDNSIVANYTNIPITIADNTIYGMYNNEDASTQDFYYTSISDKINKKFSIEKDKDKMITHNHDYLTYFILKREGYSKIYVLDNRSMEWFYWEIPIEIEGIWDEIEQSDDDVEEITVVYDKKGFVYKLTTRDGTYLFKKNYVDHNDNIIRWVWVSQINPLGSINYMKQLKSTSFIFTDTDAEDDFNLDYAIEVYKKTVNSPKAYTISDELTYIRSVNKKTYVPKLSFIRLILSNTEGSVYDYDNTTGLPKNWYNNKINLLGISFKYNLLGELM